MSRFSAGGVGGWLQSLFRAGVSRFNAGGVGGWLHSLLVAGVSRFSAGGVGGWLHSLLAAGVSQFSAGGVGGWLRSLLGAITKTLYFGRGLSPKGIYYLPYSSQSTVATVAQGKCSAETGSSPFVFE